MQLNKRRFIAGAVCPSCQLMDKVVMYKSEAGDQVRECVSCGWSERESFSSAPKELDTRVNKSRQERDAEVQTVRIIE